MFIKFFDSHIREAAGTISIPDENGILHENVVVPMSGINNAFGWVGVDLMRMNTWEIISVPSGCLDLPDGGQIQFSYEGGGLRIDFLN